LAKQKSLFPMCMALITIIVISVCASALAGAPVSDAGGVNQLLPATQDIMILAGTSRVLSLPGVQRVQVANPAVADVAVASTQDVIINGITPGITTLHTWSKDKLTSYNIRVVSDMAGIVTDLTQILNDADITITTYKESVLILTGTVSTPARKDRALTLAKAFSANVVDLIEVAPPSAPPPTPVTDLRSVIAEAIGDPAISVTMIGQIIFLEGTVNTQLARERAQLIAQALTSNIVNLIQVAQVEVIKGTAVQVPQTTITPSSAMQ